MILIRNVKTSLEDSSEVVIEKALKKLGVSLKEIKDAYVLKTSIDARNKASILKVSTVSVKLFCNEENIVKRIKKDVEYKETVPFEVKKGVEPLKNPILIAGFGPAGMFAADLLSKEGYCPIVLERGMDVDKRVEAVEKFWKNGSLNPECNVQFGEGGAGTFSDGKLTTRINDSLCDYVLERFENFGAPKETLKKAKPHIGTDKLREVVKSLRNDIVKNGGKVIFNAKITDLDIKNGKLCGVYVNNEPIATENLILAIGHSARDTFKMLYQKGVVMENKAFSVGARIEHLKSQIDKGLYGDFSGHPDLPPGEYQLSYRENNKGVYTFCMCPGGVVVPSASDNGQVVTNGMSEYLRNGENSNSALVVSVDKNDFGDKIFAGMEFQQSLEEKAFELAGKGYKACGITVGNFLENKKGINLKRVNPSYSLGLESVDFDELFPKSITEMMRKGLRIFDKKIKGFAADDSVLTGPETRTSSPVRILRDDEFEAIGIKGLYPCGEGAGYAGGIMSAAVDGVKIAMKIMEKYSPR